MPHHQPRDDHNNDQGSMRATPVKGTQEVPATAPIFEGHLYLQHPEKSGRWQWRLFRFDGTSFTCLSTRKIKLPPDTPVDATPNDHTLVQSLSSHQLNQHQQHNINHSTSFHTSHTSPLLATPKDKTLRLVSMTSASMPDLPAIATTSSNTNEPMLASYYQLPKWTVDIANISAISVLKGSKKRSPFSSNASKSKCFCIRTYDGQCHVMKAQKYKDLERWLFVLTKMWRFVQTIRDQMQKQQQQQPVVVMQPQSTPQPPTSSYPPHTSAVFMHPSSWEQQQPTFAARTFDNTMTARNLVPPPPPPPPPHIHDNTIVPTTSSPPPPVGIPSLTQPHHHQQQSTQYDARYKAPMLSMEKVHWIDQWRESLAELAAYDQKAVSPPPIEPIPDDDQVSSISGLTSISHRERSPAAAATTAPRRSIVSPRRKASKRSIRSITASMKRVAGGATHPTTDGGTIKSNSIAPANASSAAIMPQELPLEDRPSSSLKKKRSDEVKNWITSNKTEEIVIVGPDMDYFQDANTVLEKEESVNADADYRAAIRYHTSIRGRNVQLVEEDEQHVINERSNQLSHRASLIADEQIHGHSPLHTLARTDNTRALQQHINYAKRSSSPALMWQSSTTTQPLNTRGMDDDTNDDDDMSLADLQRSLRRVSVNDDPRQQQQQQQQYNRVRSPSASSILDKRAPLDTINNQRSIVYPQPHPSYYTPSSQHYSTQPLPPTSTPSIVAPAVPPVPVGRSSTPSRPFYVQPTMSSSELTSTQSKKMYHYFDTQSSRTIATDAVAPTIGKKKRPQSWMIPSTTTLLDPKSAATATPPIHPSLKATSSNSNHDHYYTRRSIDVADTMRGGSTSSNRWS